MLTMKEIYVPALLHWEFSTAVLNTEKENAML